MIYLNVLLDVRDPADVPRVETALTVLAAASRREPGCARFEVYRSQAVATQFILVERWHSEDALAAHRAAPHFADVYLPTIVPLLERTPHLCTLVSG